MHKRLMAWIIMVCLGLCWSAAAEEPAPTLVFSWWGDFQLTQATRDGIEWFKKEYRAPVEVIARTWESREEYLSGLLARWDAGDPGDLTELDGRMLQALARDASGGFQLADLEAFAGQLDLTQFSYLGLTSGLVDGRLCAVPVSMSSHVFFWNQAALKERKLKVPADTNGLVALASALWSEEGVYPLAASAESRAALMLTYLQSRYGQLWLEEETGEVSFSQEQIAEGMAYLRRFEKAGIWPPLAQQASLAEGWREGRYLGIWAWDTLAQDLGNALPESGALAATANLSDWTPYAGGFQRANRMLAIPEGAANAELSAALIEFLLNTEKGAISLGDLRGMPISISGSAAAKKAGVLDKHLTEANKIALSWARYPMVSAFETPALIGAGGIFEQVLIGLDKGALTEEAAAAAFLSGIQVTLGQQNEGD